MASDPAQIRRDLRAVQTFQAFAEEQLLPFLQVSKRSWRLDASLLRCHLIPAFGQKLLATYFCGFLRLRRVSPVDYISESSPVPMNAHNRNSSPNLSELLF